MQNRERVLLYSEIMSKKLEEVGAIRAGLLETLRRQASRRRENLQSIIHFSKDGGSRLIKKEEVGQEQSEKKEAGFGSRLQYGKNRLLGGAGSRSPLPAVLIN